MPPPRSNAARFRRTHRALLDVGRALFTDLGYTRVSMEAVARAEERAVAVCGETAQEGARMTTMTGFTRFQHRKTALVLKGRPGC